ncbi:MAG: sulfurtransferase [Erythrobacter sp.]
MERLVSTEWLAAELGASDLVVLDATLHLPDSPRNAPAEFGEGHIPGARFLDLASFVDASSDIPKALPTAEQFAARMEGLGISPSTRVVLYDDSQIRSSARAWFILDHYGHAQKAILDGGLEKWRAEERDLEDGASGSVAAVYPVPVSYRETRTKADMLSNCDCRDAQVVDARDAGRFAGLEGSGSEGHIPGAANVHFPRLFNDDGTWKSGDAIRAEFEAEGLDLSAPVTASCNSGMTACVLLFGLGLAGKDDAALYDGSWMEWGADPATPKEKGAGR